MSKITLKCAIYTRKSSEEGLEQGFNSLDAQREACEAFILSQQHEGWKLVPTMYDDGGYSGGNMERPALKQLLVDIDQKKINIVVVYKVDRLTRSLADFAKIVEQFDAKGISFVSVTQQFNTTSSMGRLTLNVLLSFAQFEREVTGERIRDKIAASKQKGLWMGGTVAIGYKGFERTLIIDEPNATIIRYIYQRYLEIGSIRTLKIDLDRQTIHSPKRMHATGLAYGGAPFSRGNLQRILTNPVYIGKITHFGKVYEGQHPAIIEMELWEAVQAKIASNKQAHQERPRVPSDSLLTGLLFDAEGQRLSPSHSQKQSKRFRYYLSYPLVNEGKKATPNGIRIPAQELENLIIDRLSDWLINTEALIQALNPAPEHIQNLIAAGQSFARSLEQNKTEQYQLLRQLLDRVEVGLDYFTLYIKPDALTEVKTEQLIPIKTQIMMRRCGYAMKLIVNDESARSNLDQNLIDYVCKGYQWRNLLISGKAQSTKEIAEMVGIDPTHVTRAINRTFLAPEIIKAILNGRQPIHFSLKYLKAFRSLPNDWEQQKTLLGFSQ